MSAGCMRWVLSHAVRAVCGGGAPVYWTPASRLTIRSERCDIIAASWRRSPFSTEVYDTEQTPVPKTKKQRPQSGASITSVGRKISQRHIQVISQTGTDMGIMHRADVIKIMNEEGLKLVSINEHKDPPVYQLMSGKQLYEEHMKLREKKKAKTAPVQMKELAFLAAIASHDLNTKLKQVKCWLEQKHHVKITVRSGRTAPAGNLDKTLEQMVEKMEVEVGFISQPKSVHDGRAASCIVRPLSAKELSEARAKKAAKSQSASSSSEASQSKRSPDSNTDTTEESLQQ